ncbi:MAG: sulfide/dihydroorotate dehydrogenase-like FAD/NAD-binding protein [Candidatus Firestonebacteria bacterium]
MGFEIVDKKEIAPKVFSMTIKASVIAKKRKPGQFILLRIDETGERIPLTIADADEKAGTLDIIFQEVGKTTMQLARMKTGEYILNVAGPLGRPTEIHKYGTVVAIGGGVGIAPLYPVAKAFKEAGNKVISIIGARTKDLLILENEMRGISDELIVTTDDGSYIQKGFVTDILKKLIDGKIKIDFVITIGPAIMMKAVSNLTKTYQIKTMVSLNSIMIDGTGMCGGCRVSVGKETKFVCVDGPEFDGHLVDFDELLKRQRIYIPQEKIATQKFEHKCNLIKE